MELHADHPGSIDLHLHSHHSDGSLSPAEVVRRAALAGVGTLSLTDHDSVDGLAEAACAARSLGLQLVPGIELSAYHDAREIHVLGYFLDPDCPALRAHLARFLEARWVRMREMIRRLAGQGVALAAHLALPPGGAYVGRPHLARALLQSGHASCLREVYERFIGPHCPAYVDKYRLSASEAFGLLHESGALAILAHPAGRYPEPILVELRDLGMDGIEVYHGRERRGTSRRLRRMAEAHGLLATGGSDFHGEAIRPDLLPACSRLPRPAFERFLEAARDRRLRWRRGSAGVVLARP